MDRDYADMLAGRALDSHRGGYGDPVAEQPSRPLESIATAAQRVNTAYVNIQRFLDRFHGHQVEPAAPEVPQPGPVNIPYSAHLDQLFRALDRLETRIDALDSIG